MTYLDILVGGVATWRLTRMFLTENGPYRVFRRIRERFGVVYVDDESLEVSSFKYEITMCMWCMSVWVGLALTLLQRFVPGGRWFLLPFIYSAINVLVGRTLEQKPQAPVRPFPEFEVK